MVILLKGLYYSYPLKKKLNSDKLNISEDATKIKTRDPPIALPKFLIYRTYMYN